MDARAAKTVAVSYSALSAWEDCARRYFESRPKLGGHWPEPETQALKDGNAIHAALAIALQLGSPLPPAYTIYQPFVEKIKAHAAGGTLLVEQKWCLNIDLNPTPWFAEDAYLRVIADAVLFRPPVAIAIDFKTGKRENQKDDLQLVMIALAMFAHFPELRLISTRYLWLNEGKETERIVKRSDAPAEWQKILPRILAFQEAHVLKKFPPNPGRFCKNYCSVKSCEFNGK
jgi:hypothetical protein